MGYMPTVIMAAGDAAATTQNMLEHLNLFRLGLAGDIAVLLLEVILTIMVYRLFKSVNRTFALVALLSRMAMSIVMGLNLLNYLLPLLLLSDATYLVAFESVELQAFAMLFLDAHQYGVYVWQLFFALHLVALGYLVFKSGYIPKVLGAMMLIGGFGYAFEGLQSMFLPDSAVASYAVIALLVVATVGELAFTFWLLIKGVNVERWNAQQLLETRN